jgi:hypothetical protein
MYYEAAKPSHFEEIKSPHKSKTALMLPGLVSSLAWLRPPSEIDNRKNKRLVKHDGICVKQIDDI